MEAFNYPPPPRIGRADYFTVAAGGRPQCCLVLPERPRDEEMTAAATLQCYVKLATGAALGILKEKDIPVGLNQIHVGDTKVGLAVALDLPPLRYGADEWPNLNGFLVKTTNRHLLVIRGETPHGTLLGAVSFLKRFLGIRRYWPGEPGGIGDVVPRVKDVSLAQTEWRDWPYFFSRTMSGCDDRGPQAKWVKGVRLYDFWRMNDTIPCNESYYRLMNARQHTNEAELFPLIDGRRFVPSYKPDQPDPHGWQPCVSNPRVTQLMADAIKDHLRENPHTFCLNLAVNDGYGDCTCEFCRAMDAPGSDPINRIGLCDRYIKFDNGVADLAALEFPDAYLAFLAYGSMSEPPKTVRLHSRLLPVLCIGGSTFQMWDQWSKTGARHMGIYLYHDDYSFIMPKVDIHQAAKRIRYIAGSGLARHFYQEYYEVPPLTSLVEAVA